MRVVLIVGAGATRGAAAPGTPPADQPPLDRGFFSDCRDSSLHITGASAQLRRIERYYRANYGIGVADVDSLELVMNTLYADSGLDRPGAFNALYSLFELFKWRVDATTKAAVSGADSGVARIIRGLCEDYAAPEELTVITFNQDLELEKAFDDIADDDDFEGLFSLPDSYRLEDPSPISGSGRAGIFRHVRATGSVSLLKLHGSLNWYRRSSVASPSPETLFSKKGEIYVGLWKNVRRKTYKVKSRYGRKTWNVYPVIVPPVSAKSSIFHRQVAALWPVAREAVRQAQWLIVYGYSCPDADFEAANLINSATVDQQPSQIDVIDPNPSVVARYHRLIGGRGIAYHADVSHFLEMNQWLPA